MGKTELSHFKKEEKARPLSPLLPTKSYPEHSSLLKRLGADSSGQETEQCPAVTVLTTCAELLGGKNSSDYIGLANYGTSFSYARGGAA